MNARRMVSIALKLIGVLLLVNSLNQVTLLLFPSLQALLRLSREQSPVSGSGMIMLSAAALIPVVYVIVCIGVIVKSEFLAGKIVQPDETFPDLGISSEKLQAIAFCVVGLVAVVNGIPDLGRTITNYYIHRQQLYSGVGMKLPFQGYGNLTASALQVAIGILLFFQAGGLVNLWKNLQTTTRANQA